MPRTRRLRPVPADERRPPVRVRQIHGHRRAYRIAGRGPALLFLHGIGDSSTAWEPVLGELARDHTVIAPDLLGHGHSAKPRADYSVGAFANGVRDLLRVLDVERVTVVGHSLGAGVAMQFAYQYPEQCERLVLVGAGGVQREVHPVLRALALPGTSVSIGALRLPTVRWQTQRLVDLLRRLDAPVGLDAQDLLRILDGLPDRRSRTAFVRTLRSVVDTRGQIVTMLDRAYLASGVPIMLVWGERDPVVPIKHAHAAHAAMPGSRLEIFDGAGHFPFRTDPERFLAVLRDFLASTAPASWDRDAWAALLRHGPETTTAPRHVGAAEAGA